ncbi:hypothetical protein RRG08_002027 [Elysia crispata]|uniref:Uncharacterized protein n=1 Tax=Elysia crispata TaxID=231223 RepID=A0AAE1B389_9GAST|nr:hypothetical protein RRG08_002027 [Elysia crispata]
MIGVLWAKHDDIRLPPVFSSGFTISVALASVGTQQSTIKYSDGQPSNSLPACASNTAQTETSSDPDL